MLPKRRRNGTKLFPRVTFVALVHRLRSKQSISSRTVVQIWRISHRPTRANQSARIRDLKVFPFCSPKHSNKTNLFLVPMESETTQKLSYPPVCPAPKEDYPWARRAGYQPPAVSMDHDTTYKKSFMPSCATERAKKIPPFNNLHVPADSGFESKTVYKESYHSASGERPPAIRPVEQLRIPCQKLEDDTVYKVYPSYVVDHSNFF